MSEGAVGDEDSGTGTDAEGDDWSETVVDGTEIDVETSKALSEPPECSEKGEEVGVRR